MKKFWIEMNGRKKYFACQESALEFAEQVYLKKGIILGIFNR